MANTHITRTQAAGNRKKFTLSAWVKRTKISYNFSMWFCAGVYQTTQMAQCYWATDDRLRFGAWDSNGNTNHYITTNREFKDMNAWYHVVVGVDTTQATASNRIKLYINGVQETSFYNDGVTEYPAQNFDYPFSDSGITLAVGTRPSYSSGYHEGYISHLHFCDGYQYAASDFGSTDSTTGEWKINTGPSVSYGTTGFAILKDGITITDQSSNSNNFSLTSGTLTKSEDCPSNVFCTLNPSIGFASSYGEAHSNAPTYSLGNTKFTKSQPTWSTQGCTMGASSGKYYWEAKMENNGGDPRLYIGVVDAEFIQGERGHVTGQTTNGVGYNSNNGKVKVSGATDATYGNSFTASDVVGCALDLDNRKIYFHKNGTWQNSGDPTSGSTGTGAAATLTADRTYIPCFTIHNSGCLANFGNGYFGTTAVSSAGTNASNLGIFEYNVPTGYTALCTKGLNE